MAPSGSLIPPSLLLPDSSFTKSSPILKLSSNAERAMRIRNKLVAEREVLSEPDQEDESSAASDNAGSDKDEDSTNSSSSSDNERKKRGKKAKKQKKKKKSSKNAAGNAVNLDTLTALLASLSRPSTSTPAPAAAPAADPLAIDTLLLPPPPATSGTVSASASEIAQQVVQLLKQNEQVDDNGRAVGKIGSKIAFKRVDQVYDRKIHNYKLKETVQADTQTDKWDQVCISLPEVYSLLTVYSTCSMFAAPSILPLVISPPRSISSQSSCETVSRRSWVKSRA